MNIFDPFFKAYYTSKEDILLEHLKDNTQDSDQSLLTKENYWTEVLKPSTLTDKDFKKLESKIKYKLPESFKAFYQTHFSQQDEFGFKNIFIIGNTENDKLKSLTHYITKNGLSDLLLQLGLIPFGMYNEKWYICLDIKNNSKDPAIKLFDMNEWQQGTAAIFSDSWFSNFSAFIACMTEYIKTNSTSEFDAIDPSHNFKNVN